MNREAEDLLKRGRSQDAAALIIKGLPLQTRLLAAPQPTLGAMEAVSDLDDLYARMLLSNNQDGWARMLFQKNLARWKNCGGRDSRVRSPAETVKTGGVVGARIRPSAAPRYEAADDAMAAIASLLYAMARRFKRAHCILGALLLYQHVVRVEG